MFSQATGLEAEKNKISMCAIQWPEQADSQWPEGTDGKEYLTQVFEVVDDDTLRKTTYFPKYDYTLVNKFKRVK